MTRRATHAPPEVVALIDALLAGVRDALGDNLLGFYLRGSLALGGFDPETSDVDLLVVTERPVSDAEFEELALLHERIPPEGNSYHYEYELSYVDRASLKLFAPGERRHPNVTSHWPFAWAEHRDNWVIERWTVREHGVALDGPDPKTLIDPISPEELRAAARSEIFIRIEDWGSVEREPDWLLERGHQAFEVQTVCRALYTLETGRMPTKPQAVTWALEALPAQWLPLIRWSQENRSDWTKDGGKIEGIRRFVRWAASESSGKGS